MESAIAGKPMKILHFVCDGAPGGGTNHVVQLLSGLGPEHQCALLTSENSYLESMSRELDVPTFTGDFFRSRTDRAAVKRIAEVIAGYQPDIVHCHGGRAAFYYGRLSDPTTSFYTVHGFHFRQKGIVPRCLGWGGEYFSIRRADHVVFVADYDRKLAVGTGLLPKQKSFQVIHNGIAKPKLAKPSSVDGTEKLGVGFVGRMVEQKNPLLFLDVIEKLPEVQAVMVGDGELEATVQTEINRRGLSNRITMLGGLPHTKALEVIADLDVLVMTPGWEGLPLLPLEAMLLNVPVVSTPVGGIPEVIDHGVSGWLGSSADELAQGVKKLLSDSDFGRHVTISGYETASKKFSQAEMLRKLKGFYQIARVAEPETNRA